MSEQQTNDNTLLALTHASGILFGFIVPLVMYFVKTDASDYAKAQIKEALNFQITIAIAYVIASALCLVVIGMFIFPIVGIINLVLCIMAAIAVKDGKEYQYPFALRLVK